MSSSPSATNLNELDSSASDHHLKVSSKIKFAEMQLHKRTPSSRSEVSNLPAKARNPSSPLKVATKSQLSMELPAETTTSGNLNEPKSIYSNFGWNGIQSILSNIGIFNSKSTETQSDLVPNTPQLESSPVKDKFGVDQSQTLYGQVLSKVHTRNGKIAYLILIFGLLSLIAFLSIYYSSIITNKESIIPLISSGN